MATRKTTETGENAMDRNGAELFAAKFAASKTLTKARDDGYTLTDRADLVDKPMILEKWELLPGIGDRPYARVWAHVYNEDTGTVVKVKFEDGGRSFDGIPATLAELQRNRVRTNVAVVLRGEPYDFEDRDTGEMKTAVRYSIVDPDAEQS